MHCIAAMPPGDPHRTCPPVREKLRKKNLRVLEKWLGGWEHFGAVTEDLGFVSSTHMTVHKHKCVGHVHTLVNTWRQPPSCTGPGLTAEQGTCNGHHTDPWSPLKSGVWLLKRIYFTWNLRAQAPPMVTWLDRPTTKKGQLPREENPPSRKLPTTPLV